jgi:hypothetical protein
MTQSCWCSDLSGDGALCGWQHNGDGSHWCYLARKLSSPVNRISATNAMQLIILLQLLLLLNCGALVHELLWWKKRMAEDLPRNRIYKPLHQFQVRQLLTTSL